MEGTMFYRGLLREWWDIVLSGDIVYSGIREICKRRLGKRAAVSIGAPLGNLEGGLLYWKI
jgi:hypothetical protein